MQRCTLNREQELQHETDVKGLRFKPDGLFVQDVTPEFSTSLAGEFLWEYAMRRRAVALDLSGLCSYQTAEKWTDVLKTYLLKQALDGYKKVTWQQLQAADVALWGEIATN